MAGTRAILTEQTPTPIGIDRAAFEQSDLQAVSFVVRVWRQRTRCGPEYRGWVEHVRSGRRTAFLGLDGLNHIIAQGVGVPTRRSVLWRSRLAQWRARLARCVARVHDG
jgi:hypothetical protein